MVVILHAGRQLARDGRMVYAASFQALQLHFSGIYGCAMTSSRIKTGITDLKENAIPFPGFIKTRLDGVFVIMSRVPPRDGIRLFIERLFASEARFEGLDYACFTHLLYGSGAAAQGAMKAPEVRIADSIVRFPAERSVLYREPRITKGGDQAEYLFEKIIVDEPIFGDPDGSGIEPVIGYVPKCILHPNQLDFDEFVAAMWLKGLRFGIDEMVVRQAIRSGKTGRITIATYSKPTCGVDAEIIEVSEALHRDNSPLVTLSGRADLRRFKNRFPQIAKDVPLLRKIPRILGEPGYQVTGEIIEPPLPVDINLAELSGPGTRIEHMEKGEFIVSSMDGFIVFDTCSNRIEVTKKVENRGGVSIRTTGDLSLSVDSYVEHGEVQEGRMIEGKDMTFLSNVYGTVISDNGNILLKGNLSGGRLQSNSGNITIEGRAFNATVQACGGSINMNVAESCMVIGKAVSIKHAVNCEILAEDLWLDVAEGCSIAGKAIRIASSGMRKEQETIITILTPDLSESDQHIIRKKGELAEIQKAAQAKAEEIRAITSQPDFAKYLAAASPIRAGVIKLTEAQHAGWQQMVNRYARQTKALAEMERERSQLTKTSLALEQEISHALQRREESMKGVLCEIKEVFGDTVALKHQSTAGIAALHDLPNRTLKTRLRQLGEPQERIFSSDEGSIKWQYKAPKQPND